MHDSDAITQLALQPISLRASCPAMCWHLRRRSGGWYGKNEQLCSAARNFGGTGCLRLLRSAATAPPPMRNRTISCISRCTLFS